MDKDALVAALTNMFRQVRSQGTVVDAFMLIPAYSGFFRNRFVLGVSAPSMVSLERYERIDKLIDLIHKHLSVDYRKMIDRVRVYDSVKDLETYAEVGFDGPYEEVYERPLRRETALIEV